MIAKKVQSKFTRVDEVRLALQPFDRNANHHFRSSRRVHTLTHDSSCSPEELETALLSLGVDVQHDQLMKLIIDLDEDHSGAVSIE